MGVVEWMLFLQTHFNKKTSDALQAFAVVASWCFLQAIRQLVKILAVCFLTMGHISGSECVSTDLGRVAGYVWMCFPTGGFDSEKKNMDLFQSEINLAEG